MAEKRMFAKSVVFSDDFLDLPPSSRLMYFTLSMVADDDGFINNPKSVIRMAGGKNDDITALVKSGFVIQLNGGVLLITHWKINNSVRKDTYKESPYLSSVTDTLQVRDGMYVSTLQVRNEPVTQNSIDKNSIEIRLENRLDEAIEENRIDKNSIEQNSEDTHTRHRYGEYSKVLLTDEEFDKLKEEFPADWSNWINRLDSYIASKGDKYKNHLATIRNWARQDKEKEQKGKINWDEV